MNELFDVQQLSQFEFGAIVLTVLIAGLVIGCLIAYGLLKRKHSPEAEAAIKIQEEFQEYKEKVDDHFAQTSEMFKDVTTQYKKLYDHMAVGAIELANADTVAMPRLEMQESEDQTSAEAEVTQTEESEQTETTDSTSTDDSVEQSSEPTQEDLAEQNQEDTAQPEKQEPAKSN